MKLRTKVSLVLSIAWIIALILVYLDFHFIILNDYREMEKNDIASNYKLTQENFKRMFDTLKSSTFDWAHWDDTYIFLRNKKSGYIEKNLTPVSFNDMKINFILFYDISGHYFYGHAYDFINQKPMRLPNDILSTVKKSNLTRAKDIDFVKSGFLKIKDGYVVICTAAVTDSVMKAPVDGNIIFGYLFNDLRQNQLKKLLRFNFNIIPLEDVKIDPVLNLVSEYLAKGEKYYFIPKNDQIMYVFSFLNDINDNHIGIIRLEIERTTYESGLKQGKRYIYILIIIGVLFVFLMWLLLKVILLDRLSRLKSSLQEIVSTSDFSKTINVEGNDEISDIAKNSDEMLKIVDLTQKQLRSRLRMNISDLEQMATLNKNLAEEINKHLSLEENLEKEEKILQEKAYYDQITGLPNRAFFFELLTKNLINAEREKIIAAVLFLDLDKFKSINDTYGHNVGDTFLKHIGIIINHSMRKGDIIGRIGGDEFLFYINNIKSTNELNNIVERTLALVKTPMLLQDKKSIMTSASIGISLYPQDGTDIDTLIHNADQAMYYAKKQGGDSYVYYQNP